MKPVRTYRLASAHRKDLIDGINREIRSCKTVLNALVQSRKALSRTGTRYTGRFVFY